MKERSQERKLSPAVLLSGAAVTAGVLGLAKLTRSQRREGRSLTGKVALITGGSRGLGLELARQLGRSGCRLILVARHGDQLQNAETELREAGYDVRAIPADVSSETDLPRVRDEVLAAHGRLDILVNNAGIISVGPIESLRESDFREAMDVMYWGMVRTTLTFLPKLIESGDSDIINVTSIGGKVAVPHLLPYSAAKFAAVGFSQGIGAELRRRGVHVLTVAPGLMRTGSIFNAEFTGDVQAEYRWFAVSASLPGISISVERAAAQIIESLRRRDRELTITLLAQIASQTNRLFPEFTQQILETANEFVLPRPKTNNRHVSGRDADASSSRVLRAATALGRQAAATHNENPPRRKETA